MIVISSRRPQLSHSKNLDEMMSVLVLNYPRTSVRLLNRINMNVWLLDSQNLNSSSQLAVIEEMVDNCGWSKYTPK
jgi:hypothetical protein